MVAFEPADGQFDSQQHTQGVTCAVHGPDGPRLGGAEGPGTKQCHQVNDRFSQVVADSIKLHVVGAQRAIGVYECRLAVSRGGYKLNAGTTDFTDFTDDYGTTRPRDYGTTGLQDYGTTGLRDYRTTRLRDHQTTGLKAQSAERGARGGIRGSIN